jgi:hypothetical protein
MQTYTLFIDDDRYSVPTLQFVTADDAAAMWRIAREKLSEPHHLAVEVREGDLMLVHIERSGNGTSLPTKPH